MTRFVGLRIDRIDSRGNICEHILREHSDYPLCGVNLNQTQSPLGNRPCKNCLRVYARGQQQGVTTDGTRT